MFTFKCWGSTAALLAFLCVFHRKRKDLHKRELLKYHEYFPNLVFEGNLLT